MLTVMDRVDEMEAYPVFHLDVEVPDIPSCNYLNIVNSPDYDWCNKFSILLCNIRSCRKNFLDFTSYFDNVITNYSCVILVETWLSTGYDELFTLRGFKSYNVYRNNYGGGIRLYIRNIFCANILDQYSFVHDTCEMLCAEISCDNNKLILCCIYHPPTSDHALNYNFIEQIHQILTALQGLGLPLVLGGDLNLNLFNPLRLNYITHFTDCLLEFGLLPLINIPTKYNPQNTITKYSLVDQFWVSSSLPMVDAYVVPIEIADHFPCAMALSFSTTNVNTYTKTRVFNHSNNICFSRLLADLVPAIVDDDMNLTFHAYYSNLFTIYDTAYPMVRRRVLNNRTENKEWLTPRIRACIKKKSKLYKMYLSKSIIRESYTFYANKLTTLLHKARKLYYFKLFSRDPKNCRKTWFYINRLVGNSTKGQMEKLKVGGEIFTGMRMVNYANNYFVSVANRLTEGIQDNGQYRFFTARNPYTFEMRPTNIHEVIKVIHSLKNKGNGLIDISVTTIKNNSHIFSVHIVLLYNYSIDKCVFPNKLKVARVIPGHKSGQNDLIDNFRPISNLPAFSKIFEKLSHRRMMSFVDKHELLSESQFGFRRGKSTTQATLRFTSKIVGAYHKKQYATCFFLDLRKAFDVIDHNILLTKMEHIGFRGYALQYLRSYLTGRKQCTQVGDFKSEECIITKGVPQGSILGPVLFCLYINDIVKAVDVEVVLFADDAAFIILADTLEELYGKIEKLFLDLSKYLEANRLIPNLNKSKLMYFDSRPIPELRNLSFNDQIIEWVEEYKYLGLALTHKMSFSLHINNIVTRISRFIGTFSCLRVVVPRSILTMLYSSFVLPHILLHIEIWGAAPEVHKSRLDIKINMLLRSILGVSYVNGRPTIDTTSMYNQLGILKLKNVYKLRLYNLLISLLSGSLPDLFEMLLGPYLTVHNYSTRQRIFRTPFVSCEVERRAVAYQLIHLYNDIPFQYINTNGNSLKRMVKLFKQHVFYEQ